MYADTDTLLPFDPPDGYIDPVTPTHALERILDAIGGPVVVGGG